MSKANWKKIYAMKSDDGYVKIGISKNPEIRAKHLEDGRFKVVDIFSTDLCSNPFIVERICHAKLNEHRAFGEWFYVDFEDAKKIVEDVFSKWALFHEVIHDNEPMEILGLFEKSDRSSETMAMMSELCIHQSVIIESMSSSINSLINTVTEIQELLLGRASEV